MKSTKFRILTIVIASLLIILMAISFIPLNKPVNSARIDFEIKTVAEVHKPLKNACYDCHSNQTKWPVYSKIFPFSYYIYEEVRKGREYLNFSEWAKYSQIKQKRLLEKSSMLLKKKEMPPPLYRLLNPGQTLSENEELKLYEYFHELSKGADRNAGWLP